MDGRLLIASVQANNYLVPKNKVIVGRLSLSDNKEIVIIKQCREVVRAN